MIFVECNLWNVISQCWCKTRKSKTLRIICLFGLCGVRLKILWKNHNTIYTAKRMLRLTSIFYLLLRLLKSINQCLTVSIEILESHTRTHFIWAFISLIYYKFSLRIFFAHLNVQKHWTFEMELQTMFMSWINIVTNKINVHNFSALRYVQCARWTRCTESLNRIYIL